MTIAWTTCEKYADLTPDEQVMVTLLRSQGVDVRPVVWDSEANWNQFELVLVRTIWDYHVKIDKYLSWLDDLSKSGVVVLNPLKVLQWNYHKFYLQELSQKGVPVAESSFIRKGDISRLNEAMANLKTEEVILKPAISATAYGLLKVQKHELSNPSKEVRDLISYNDVIVQEFIEDIQHAGEWSFLYFNGEFSHAVLKRPQVGDFRVQSDYGGTVEVAQPEEAILEQVARALSGIDEDLLYCRIDGMVLNGQFMLMELELIEPELFLKTEEIRNRFASAIRKHL